MRSPGGATRVEFSPGWTPVELCRRLRRTGGASLLLDGAGSHDPRWSVGPLVAIDPRPVDLGGAGGAALERLEGLIGRRRTSPGPAETGVAALISYDLFDPEGRPRQRSELPLLLAMEVDRSVRFLADGAASLTIRGEASSREAAERCRQRLDGLDGGPEPRAARVDGPPRTSLPRERYVRAVENLKHRIALGDIYQANLCQQFRAGYSGDELQLYEALAAGAPAPRSAFLEVAGIGLASISPETFLRVRSPDRVDTFPIKGTRPRRDGSDADAAIARELLGSAKDRAELLMIVDLERNDLGRVCRTGSIEVHRLAELQSFPTVHHLIARVSGRLRPDAGIVDLLRATFPGGSISGAPKIRARQLLDPIEPVRRSFFTGSLFWFGDDGSVESSILIRSLVFAGGRVLLGAGGGIVADSDPVQEWCESNHKARALAEALGFSPEDAR